MLCRPSTTRLSRYTSIFGLLLAACSGDVGSVAVTTATQGGDSASAAEVVAETSVAPETVAETSVAPEVVADTVVAPEVVADTSVAPEVAADTSVEPEVAADTSVEPEVAAEVADGPEQLQVFFAATADFDDALHATQSGGMTYLEGAGTWGRLVLTIAGTSAGTYTCDSGVTDVVWTDTNNNARHAHITDGSCSITITTYGAIGARIVGTFHGAFGDPSMPGMGTPFDAGVFSVARAVDDACGPHSCAPGTCNASAPVDGCSCPAGYDASGIGCVAKCPAPPTPPSQCPAACTGGCADGVCTIDCSGSKCSGGGPPPNGKTVTCPDGMACKIACTSGGCTGANLICPATGGCEIACSGTWACQDASVTCGGGACHATSCGTDDMGMGTATMLAWTCGSSCDCGTGCGR